MQLSELGDALRKARKERHLTLKELASQSGLHFTTLSALERGAVSELGVRKIMRVAETLGLELVLRPVGQSYTLDDVAQERNAKPDNPALGRYAANKLTEHMNSLNKFNELQKAQESFTTANKLAEQMNSLNKFNELQKAQESFTSANKLAEQMRSFEEVNRLQKAQESLTSANKLNEQLKSFSNRERSYDKFNELQKAQESLTSANKLNEQLKSFNKLDQLQKEQESLTRQLKQQDLLDRVLGKK